MTALLEVKNLSKSFGGIKAVDDVSFDLKRGELLALIGPNGAGKSTCFNMLMGQLSPTSGKVNFEGKSIANLPTRKIWRKGIGRTFQITGTYSSMTVVENVQMALISYHRKVFSLMPYAHKMYKDRALELLDLVNLSDQAERHCAILAYGDLKRLELAIALCHDPHLLLMDEPTAGMAPTERENLMQLTSDIVRDKNISVLFTEHDMDVVFSHSHRIMVLNRGQLIANGSVEEIKNNDRVKEVYLGGGSLYEDKEVVV